MWPDRCTRRGLPLATGWATLLPYELTDPSSRRALQREGAPVLPHVPLQCEYRLGYVLGLLLWHCSERCGNAALVAYGFLSANSIDDSLEIGPYVVGRLHALAVPDGWEIPRVEVGEDLQRGAQPRL